MYIDEFKELYHKFKIYGFVKTVVYLFQELSLFLYWNLARHSYSQSQEDLVLEKIFKGQHKGFYIDIGANNPLRFNNTKKFYDKGWSGINIEPSPRKFELIQKYRPRDLNINVGVGNSEGVLELNMFEPDTLNTFSETNANLSIKKGFKLIKKYKVEMITLRKLLEMNNIKGPVDFMSVDTEGFDLSVLEGIDWSSFKVRYIVIEKNDGDHVEKFLRERGFSIIYETKFNVIYKSKDEVAVFLEKQKILREVFKNIVFTALYYLYKIVPARPFQKSIARWNKENGETGRLFNHNLNEESIVFDVGGYLGYFSSEISKRYNPTIYIFEPVNKYYTFLQKLFSENAKVHVENYGLLNKTTSSTIVISGDGTSLYKEEGFKEQIQLIDILEFVRKEGVSKIDLLSINAEGSEFDLIERILDSGIVGMFNTIQVQFHYFFKDSEIRRARIIKELLKTHKVKYSYPFVWECYELKTK